MEIKYPQIEICVRVRSNLMLDQIAAKLQAAGLGKVWDAFVKEIFSHDHKTYMDRVIPKWFTVVETNEWLEKFGEDGG